YPQRLEHLPQIESCYSVAGEAFYILRARGQSPQGLEELLQQIREAAKVSTRTTVALATPSENRPPAIGRSQRARGRAAGRGRGVTCWPGRRRRAREPPAGCRSRPAGTPLAGPAGSGNR